MCFRMRSVSIPEASRPALARNPTQQLKAEIDVDVSSDHNFYAGFSANLSDAGLFVATYQPQAVETFGVGKPGRVEGSVVHADTALPNLRL